MTNDWKTIDSAPKGEPILMGKWHDNSREIPEDGRAEKLLMEFDWPDMGPEMANAAGKPGWTYRDQSWMKMADWDRFIDIAGTENVEFLASSSKGDMARGQFLISPVGIERVREFASAIRRGSSNG